MRAAHLHRDPSSHPTPPHPTPPHPTPPHPTPPHPTPGTATSSSSTSNRAKCRRRRPPPAGGSSRRRGRRGTWRRRRRRRPPSSTPRLKSRARAELVPESERRAVRRGPTANRLLAPRAREGSCAAAGAAGTRPPSPLYASHTGGLPSAPLALHSPDLPGSCSQGVMPTCRGLSQESTASFHRGPSSPPLTASCHCRPTLPRR
jgi:hypothetical protein